MKDFAFAFDTFDLYNDACALRGILESLSCLEDFYELHSDRMGYTSPHAGKMTATIANNKYFAQKVIGYQDAHPLTVLRLVPSMPLPKTNTEIKTNIYH